MHVSMFTVDRVVACHQSPWFGFLDGYLKRLEIDFPHCFLTDIGIHSESLSLLLVDGKMFDCSTDTLILYAVNVLSCKPASQKGIFRERLEVATAKWMAMWADGWSKTVWLVLVIQRPGSYRLTVRWRPWLESLLPKLCQFCKQAWGRRSQLRKLMLGNTQRWYHQ
jgi:hypothetical protein